MNTNASSDQAPDLSIIIPVYNDRESILPGYRALCRALEHAEFSWEVLYVDDGSKDAPREIFEAHGIPYLQHDKNRGYGAAIKTGARAAKGRYLCIIDCDGTYPAEMIPALFRETKTHDQIIGSRDVRINPWVNRISKIIVCSLLTSLFGQRVEDINSGLRIIRADVFRALLPGIRDRFSLTSSLTYGFLLFGKPLRYVPIDYHKRTGLSHVRSLSFTVEFFRSLGAMWRHVRRMRAQGETILRPDEKPIPTELDVPSPLKSERISFLIVTALAMGLGVFYLWPQFTNPYVTHDDVHQHSWWTVVFHDPTLFPNYLFLEYARSMTTPGFSLIYYLLTAVWDPIFAGKLLSIVLFGLTAGLLYLCGREIAGRPTGVLMFGFFCSYAPFIDRFEAGLQRAFMYPLLALLFLMLLRQAGWLMGWLLGTMLLFYPPAGIIAIATLAVFCLLDPAMLRRAVAGWAARIGWVFLAAIGAYYVLRVSNKPDFLGEMMSGAEMYKDPAYWPKGRAPYFPLTTWQDVYWKFTFLKSKWLAFYGWLGLLFPMLLLVAGGGWRRKLAPFLAITISSLALFAIAREVMFKLYIPDRYVEYTMRLMGIGFATLGGASLIKLFNRRWIAALICGVMVFSVARDRYHESNNHIYNLNSDYSRFASLYDFVRTLPKDTLIAADPRSSDPITTWGQRMTLIKYELAHPWFKNFREIITTRTFDFYEALYATDVETVRRVRDKYGIDYFLVEYALFDKSARRHRRLMYEPIESDLRKRHPLTEPLHYVMLDLADKAAVCREPRRWALVPVDDEHLALLDSRQP